MKTKNKYLLAVSGGPDSMALLDMFKDKYEVRVCHVNYHQRNSALRDENIVKNYCLKYNIPFVKYDYSDNSKGNFQDKARVFRYRCFADEINKHHLNGVLVAHHKDDLLETYILQKQRGSLVNYFGLKKTTTIMDVKVIRPLLKYDKKQLEEYCQKNGVEFGIDESNLTDHYKRNRIRHHILYKMSANEKNELIKEIKYKNYFQQQEEQIISNFISHKTKFSYEEFMSCPYLKRLIRHLTYPDLSDKYLDEVIKVLESKGNQELKIRDCYIYKEYNYIEIALAPYNYSYSIDKINYKKYKEFIIANKGNSFQGVTVSQDDFPLTIRNYQEGDYIKMRYGTKKINRFFIDNKIPTSKRKMWPILFNKQGDAILVPGIGCNISHYSTKHNLYLI